MTLSFIITLGLGLIRNALTTQLTHENYEAGNVDDSLILKLTTTNKYHVYGRRTHTYVHKSIVYSFKLQSCSEG